MTVRTLSRKNLILETREICLQSEQGLIGQCPRVKEVVVDFTCLINLVLLQMKVEKDSKKDKKYSMWML